MFFFFCLIKALIGDYVYIPRPNLILMHFIDGIMPFDKVGNYLKSACCQLFPKKIKLSQFFLPGIKIYIGFLAFMSKYFIEVGFRIGYKHMPGVRKEKQNKGEAKLTARTGLCCLFGLVFCLFVCFPEEWTWEGMTPGKRLAESHLGMQGEHIVIQDGNLYRVRWLSWRVGQSSSWGWILRIVERTWTKAVPLIQLRGFGLRLSSWAEALLMIMAGRIKLVKGKCRRLEPVVSQVYKGLKSILSPLSLLRHRVVVWVVQFLNNIKPF